MPFSVLHARRHGEGDRRAAPGKGTRLEEAEGVQAPAAELRRGWAALPRGDQGPLAEGEEVPEPDRAELLGNLGKVAKPER